MTKILHDDMAIRIRGTLPHRRLRDKFMRFIGIGGIVMAMTILILLFGDLIHSGLGSLYTTKIRLNIEFTPEIIDPDGNKTEDSFKNADFYILIKNALVKEIDPDHTLNKGDTRKLYQMVSKEAINILAEELEDNPEYYGQTAEIWLPAGEEVVLANQKSHEISPQMASWLRIFQQKGALDKKFNSDFFKKSDSRRPESAGIFGGIIGSLMLMAVCFATAFPIGVLTAIYLQEFVDKSRLNRAQLFFVDGLEITINSLASVPAIVYGLLGLGVLINVLQFPRSATITGGVVLGMMSLPVIIISTRSALRTIPANLREAILGIGANRLQLVMHHLFPLALPGICTGTIIAISRAIGETAPLLMIGMVAFIMGRASSIFDASTALPVQIYIWANSSEELFINKTASAILVLILTMVFCNIIAIIIRQKFTKRF